ncbi:MAG: transposase family protein [Actinobacteria bacterium]|nr:transposase family protein [Actinomycetota bacterium]
MERPPPRSHQNQPPHPPRTRPGSLIELTSRVADPRKTRGVRHRLVTVLAAAVCAVLAGARSYVAIAEWAHDLPISVRMRLGIGRAGPHGGAAPSESTFRRVLRAVDADQLDRVVAAWLAERTAAASGTAGSGAGGSGAGGSGAGGSGAGGSGAGRPVRAIAVDGKTARGARRADGRAVHLLGALEQASGIVLGQTEIQAKTNEITAFAPLLDRIDITGAVITADALCRRRHKASYEDVPVMPMCWPEPLLAAASPDSWSA